MATETEYMRLMETQKFVEQNDNQLTAKMLEQNKAWGEIYRGESLWKIIPDNDHNGAFQLALNFRLLDEEMNYFGGQSLHTVNSRNGIAPSEALWITKGVERLIGLDVTDQLMKIIGQADKYIAASTEIPQLSEAQREAIIDGLRKQGIPESRIATVLVGIIYKGDIPDPDQRGKPAIHI